MLAAVGAHGDELEAMQAVDAAIAAGHGRGPQPGFTAVRALRAEVDRRFAHLEKRSRARGVRPPGNTLLLSVGNPAAGRAELEPEARTSGRLEAGDEETIGAVEVRHELLPIQLGEPRMHLQEGIDHIVSLGP